MSGRALRVVKVVRVVGGCRVVRVGTTAMVERVVRVKMDEW